MADRGRNLVLNDPVPDNRKIGANTHRGRHAEVSIEFQRRASLNRRSDPVKRPLECLQGGVVARQNPGIYFVSSFEHDFATQSGGPVRHGGFWFLDPKLGTLPGSDSRP
jgi:hypothetical protein